MNKIIISYKEFVENPSIIFNYDHSKIKIGNLIEKSNNNIQLGYFKDNKLYDKFIIEATNDDIVYFNTATCQYFYQYDDYIDLKNYCSILKKIILEIIEPKMIEINNKNHYYKNISYIIRGIDKDKLYNGNKMPKGIPIIYKTDKNIEINLINIYSDLLNDLVNNNKVKIQLELKCNMITPWDSTLDNLVELNMNIINIEIFKNKDYDDNLIIQNTIINNEIDFSKCFYNFDNILDELEDKSFFKTFDFKEKIINILNHFNINYKNENEDYNILNRCYVIGEDTYFTNMTIIFDDRFLNYDITEKIKQEFCKVDTKNEYCMNDIFFVEKEKNKEYIIIYSNNYRYGYGGTEINEIFTLYSNILKMLVNICDINKYTKKIDNKSIQKHNKYNIINRTLDNYINEDYSEFNDELLNKALINIIKKNYKYDDYNYVNACIEFENGIKCFQNKTIKNEFDKELKLLIKEKEMKKKTPKKKTPKKQIYKDEI